MKAFASSDTMVLAFALYKLGSAATLTDDDLNNLESGNIPDLHVQFVSVPDGVELKVVSE